MVCPDDGTELVSADNDPLVGQVVSSYRVERRLGLGGMSAVYEAVETNIGRKVALKIVHQHLSDDPNLPTLLSEARAVNSIGDEGIVDIFGFGKLPDGRSYLVMELLSGESVEARLKRQKQLSVAEVLELAIPVLHALEAAHAAGFVHRDIKTGNLFIHQRPNRPPLYKVLDLGLAMKVKQGSTFAMGTPDYVAPEQAANKRVGPKADLYAFGVVLYELLTGKLPFANADANRLISMHQSEPRPHVKALRPDVPEALDALIRALMDIEAVARPASAAVVREQLLELQRSLSQQPVVRSRAPLVFAGVGALVLVAGLVWAVTRSPPPPVVTPVEPALDPIAQAVKQAAEGVEVRLDAGVLAGRPGDTAVDALLAAEVSFPNRAEWVALRGRLSTTLRAEAQQALARDSADDAQVRLEALKRLGALPDDDALVAESKRLSTALHSGMVHVGAVFIDRFEYPNRQGARPATKVDYDDAVKLCEGLGKHLCSEAEWESACSGPAHTKFPWGDTAPGPKRCVTKGAKAPAQAGSFKSCVGPSGVADLVGNVAEWTSTPFTEGKPQRVIRGGSYLQSDAKLACDVRDYSLPGQGGSSHLGFRCCL